MAPLMDIVEIYDDRNEQSGDHHFRERIDAQHISSVAQVTNRSEPMKAPGMVPRPPNRLAPPDDD